MFILTLPTQEYAPSYGPGERVTNVLMLVTKMTVVTTRKATAVNSNNYIISMSDKQHHTSLRITQITLWQSKKLILVNVHSLKQWSEFKFCIFLKKKKTNKQTNKQKNGIQILHFSQKTTILILQESVMLVGIPWVISFLIFFSSLLLQKKQLKETPK